MNKTVRALSHLILVTLLLGACFFTYRFYSFHNNFYTKQDQVNYRTSAPQVTGISTLNTNRFAIIADTQQTSWMEYVFLFREINDRDQILLLNKLYQTPISFLIIAGDLVFDSSSTEQWRYFDRLIKPFIDNKIPIYPALGNHEYWGDIPSSKKNIIDRFSFLKSSVEQNKVWYQFIKKDIGFIILDSNYEELQDELWAQQLSFLKNTLSQWETKDSIKHVLLINHHPPYSNKPTVHGSEKVRNDIVPVFCKAKKTRLFIAGHAHGYERFANIPNLDCKGQQFIVSGGGGGPRPDEYLREGETGLIDSFPIKGKRPLNYLIVEKLDGINTVKTMGLRNKKVIEIDRFSF